MFASPRIELADWQSGKFSDIDIFEDQLDGWLFAQAKYLADQAAPSAHHAGPAILALVSPYFEMVTCYREGRRPERGESARFLKNGLKNVFPEVADDAIKAYAQEVRHGFAHEAMFRKVVIHRGGDLAPFGMHPSGALAVNPWWILMQAEAHFRSYVEMIRADANTSSRRAFNDFMSARKQ